MGIRSQSDKIRKKSKAEDAGSRAGSTRPASVSSNQPKVQNFDEWTRAKNAKDFDEWTRIRNGQTDQRSGVSMRQGTKQTSTAESRLSQRRFEATSSRSTEPKTAEDYKRAKQAAEWEQYAADSRAKRLQAIMARTPVQVETENGMEEYKPYTWLNDQLTGEILTSSEKGAEAARQSDLYWYATQAENRAKASAALGGDEKVDTLLDQYNGKPSTPENADEIRQRLSEVEALMQVTPIQIETENGMVGNPEYTRLVDEQSDLYSRLNGGRLAAASDLQAAGLSADEIEETAAYRQMLLNEQAQSKRTEFAKRHTGSVAGDIGTSLLSVPANLIGGVLGYADAARQGIGNAIAGNGRPIDWNTDAMALANTANTIRGLVSEDLEKKFQTEILGTNVASFLYQTGMSMADSGVIAGLSLIGVPAAASLLSGSAAFSSAQEAKQRGGTDAQALGYGLAAGIAEGLFETVSLEALTENLVGGLSTAAARETGGKKILKILESAGLQMLTEGSEEVATSIANRISDDVIMGDRSSYNTAVREYMASGMSENEAKKKAAEDWLTDLLGDFLGGALSGGIMGGAGTAISASVQGRNEQRISALQAAAEAQVQQETPQDILQRVAMESVQEQASPENTQRIMEQMTETPQQAMERLASETVAPRAEPAYNGDINETEVGDNGREDLYLRGSGERNDSQNPGGQVSAVEEDAGRDQSRDVQTRPADGGAASLTYGEKISTKALGIANGSTTGTVRLVKSGETEATREAAKLAEENGVKLVLFGGGNLRVKNKNGAYVEARGMKIGDTIYCRADHARYTAEQLTRHEIGHKWIADGEVNVDAVKEKLAERFTPEELDHLAGMYIDAYGSTELTANEVWEEAICDALGFMNMFEGFAEEGDAAVFLVESGRAASEVREETKAAKGQKFSIDKIIGSDQEDYGIGVHLDSTLLENLTPKERIEMVKERVKELGGEVFTAYDSAGDAIDISIAKPAERFKNRNGKNKLVNKDLTTKYIGNETKQEAVVLLDELIETASFDASKNPAYPHGWLDDYGKNNWDYWTTYVQDRNGTIWEATLNVATAADGRKILYDIGPIKKVGQSVESDTSLLPTGPRGKSRTSAVNDSVTQNVPEVKQDFSRELDSDGRKLTEAQQEFFKDSKVVDEGGNLLVMYHGTTAYGEITKFRKGSSGWLGPGIYLSSRKADAQRYANAMGEGNGSLYELYANVTNPLVVTQNNPAPEILMAAYGRESVYKNRSAKQSNGTYIITPADIKKLQSKGYDGIRWDFSGSTELSVFSSEQLKRVDNTSPTGVQDIRFSRELSIDRLNEENDLLQQTIEGFRENGETMGAVSEQDAEKVARKIIREYSGTITADDISGDVRELSGMIERGDWDAAKAKAMEISQGVVNSALAESEGYAESAELYKEIKETLRNEKILISREASRDIPDYNQWRKRYFGRLNVKIADGDTGVSGVDAVYERLSGKYPGIFKPGALAESDALLSIADALDKMRPELTNPHSYYMTEATEYCANELINLLAGDRMKKAAPKAAERIETLASEGRTRTQEALDKLREAYGTIKPGENPSREVAMPKKTSERKHLSQTVRTILESNVTPDVALPTIEQAVLDGDFSYTRYSDKAAIEDAKGTIQNKGWDQSLEAWKEAANEGIISKENTAIGWALYNNAVNDGNINTAMDILGKIVTQQRNAAQAVQATRLLKKMSPEAQLYQVSRSVANIQEELKRRYKDKAPKLKINEEYAEEFLNAKTDKERDAASEKLFRDIGRQVPTTFRDRWNAWRYLSMLLNPRTHIRNIAGNFGFAIPVAIKNVTATGIEKIVSAVSGGKIERSKSPVLTSKAGRALLQEGWADYKNVADEVSAGKKYSDSAMQNQQVEAGRRIFGNTRFQAWNKTGGRALEAARKVNSYALEVEDVWFSKPHYAFAFAQYCKASGVTAEQVRNGTADEVKLFKARAYAIKEAQKATYHDTNAFSEWVSGLGRYDGESTYGRAGSVLLEGILPFRKTPANILARGVEYSPLGFLNGLKKAMFDVRKGKSTAAEAIDSISAGLTGAGLLGLGIYLAAQGAVRGLGAGDDDEREFADLQGQQDYSMIIGDQSYTLDWLAPEALPFFIGVNLFEEMKTTGDGVTFPAMLNAVKHVSEPLLSMTCLQSLNDIFSSVGYASQEGLSGMTNAIASAATSYLTQAIPTILGQAERTAQADRMTTYTEKNGFLTGDAQYALGKASSRTPGWDYNQIPYIDAWGRRETTNSLFTRGVNNFLNPAYASTIESSDMEKELERLYGETSSSAVFPSRAAKYFNVDGERVDLTGKQYVTYAAWKGQLSYKLMTELVGTDYYKQADDVDKAELVSKVYEYANAVAKTKVSGYKLDGWVEKAADAESYGVSVTEYLRWKTVGTENFSSTAYASAVKSGTAGKVEAELSRLDAAVDSSVFPSAADKKFSVDKQQIELTDSQYAKYAEEKGGLSYQYVAELVGDDFYKAASDKEKGKMVSAVYEYANAVAKTKVSDYALDGWYKKAADAKSYGVSVTQYIWFRSIADADGNGSVTQEEAAEAVRALGLTSRTAKAKLWQSCNEKWKNNPF